MQDTITRKIINNNIKKIKNEVINLIKDYNKFYELKDKEIFQDLNNIFEPYFIE